MLKKFHLFRRKNSKVNYDNDGLKKLMDDGHKTQAVNLGLSNRVLDAIRKKLANQYSKVIINAFNSQDPILKKQAYNHLVEILNTDTAFSKFPTFHNVAASQVAANDVAGMGIFGRIYNANPNITDMGFNGKFLTVETSNSKKIFNGKDEDGEPLISSDTVDRFVQMFAKADGKSFNQSQPIFNGFQNDMRISATHKSLTPDNRTTLSIRIARPKLALNTKNFYKFASNGIYTFLDECIQAHANTVISGETGTGKTELQKLLIGSISFADKIVNIEDVNETHLSELYPDKDILDWLTKTTDVKTGNKEEDETQITIETHVKNALRNNPKWIMIAETRGGEAYQMFQSVLSGHSIVTTMHAIQNSAVRSRFAGMAMQSDECKDATSLKNDFLKYMHIGIHISRKEINGTTYRYLDDLSCFVPQDEKHPDGVAPIYRQVLHEDLTRTVKTYKMPQKIIDLVSRELDDNDLVGHMLRDEALDFSGKGHEFTENINY